MLELALRLGIGFAEPAERLVDLGRSPGLWPRLPFSQASVWLTLTAFFATDLAGLLLSALRMILAMIGVY